jgi:undecaprenyl pyrophosphate phosphatase UppP
MAKYIYYNHDLFLLIRQHSLLLKKDSNQNRLNRLALYIIIYSVVIGHTAARYSILD